MGRISTWTVPCGIARLVTFWQCAPPQNRRPLYLTLIAQNLKTISSCKRSRDGLIQTVPKQTPPPLFWPYNILNEKNNHYFTLFIYVQQQKEQRNLTIQMGRNLTIQIVVIISFNREKKSELILDPGFSLLTAAFSGPWLEISQDFRTLI